MITDSIKPENVYALVVGIEKYQAGPDYDLNGPAKDALKFAEWLLDHNVKPQNIQLFLSTLDKNVEVLEGAKARGLTPETATHDQIAQAIRSQLTSENRRGGLLYVFWGGHGIVTKKDATVRRLFFADTDDDSKWNLDFNSLLEALSTSVHGAGFPQQIFFIDACANLFYQGLAQTIQCEAAGVRFASSGQVERAEQFVLFASAEYEISTNESDVGTGSFSKAVLNELQGQPLFLEMERVAERIQLNFLEKQKQPPIYLWLKCNGNQRVIDNTNPFQPLSVTLNPKQMKDLHKALIEAFPDESDLEMLVLFHLQIRLNRISMAKKYDKVIFDVIQFVNARGKVRDLVKGALDTNPDSPFLSQFINFLS
jgi:hypothetical protein